MKIRTKMLIIFLLLSIIPITIISLVSIYSFRGILEESIGTNFSMLAKEKANSIDSLIDARIDEVETIADMIVVRDAVHASNRKYRGKSDAFVTEELFNKDVPWIASKGETELAKEIHGNALSKILKDYQSRNRDKYGEIFVTDIEGATVAMTKPLTDYFQADEQWWKASFNKGSGKVFLDHRGFDESIGALVIGVVVPVMDSGKVIGILKVNYKVSEIIKVVSSVRSSKRSEAFLLDTRGTVVAYSGSHQMDRATPGELAILKNKDAGWIEESIGRDRLISAFAPLKSDTHTRVPALGAIKGVSGERWELSKWYIFIRLHKGEAFASIYLVQRAIFIIGILSAFAAVILAVFVTRAFSRPIETLTMGVRSIGEGSTLAEVNIESSDEIGALSKAFNEMAQNLRETTVSRDILTKEIGERKEAEKTIKKSLKEKEVLLKEVHHRVKNNLQVISSLLNLQKGHISDPEAINVFEESQNRVMSMAMIHEMLYQSEDFSSVDLKVYLQDLTAKLFSTYRQDGTNIKLKENIDSINVEIDTAIQLGLVANELISNALKYAFNETGEGTIKIEFLKGATGSSTFSIKDNGSGMPEGFSIVDTDSLGLRIVELMVKQLDAKMELISDNGTEFTITLPRINI
ncbi:MAG: HAMP domain-containing protein [Proteobacteria bacterium]|nr:HAMP domain-containing protein [Pseudomonadota bacterium]